MIGAIITILIVFAGMFYIRSQMPPRVVKVDLVTITTHYTELMLQDTINSNSMTADNPQIKKISDNIKANLEPAIANYAKEHNVIVVQAQAIVGGDVPDITQLVIDQLNTKLK